MLKEERGKGQSFFASLLPPVIVYASKKNQLIRYYRQCEHGELDTGDTSQGTPDDDENDGDGGCMMTYHNYHRDRIPQDTFYNNLWAQNLFRRARTVHMVHNN